MIQRTATAIIPFCMLAVMVTAGWGGAAVTENFDGDYKDGLFDGWKTDMEPWGEEPAPAETKPGHGDSGSAQSLATKGACHYVYKTFSGLKEGETYQMSVWIRAGFQKEGARGFPGAVSWVEFAVDPRGGDRARGLEIWNVEPKYDFDKNMGKWVQYTSEPFKAAGEKATVVFKVGSVDSDRGFRADFDDLTIEPAKDSAKPGVFPEKFDGKYTRGLAEGWKRRFIHGGVTPVWEEDTGREGDGSAQRLYASDDAPNKAVMIGQVKQFKVEPGTYKIKVWIKASSTLGTPLADKDTRDIGPVVRFGVDPTGQADSLLVSSILWNQEPKAHFMVMGNQNQWKEFESPEFEAKGDMISVWLWVQGDYITGVSAAFDDLTLEKVEK